MPKIPNQQPQPAASPNDASWLDLSVLTEMAGRLRAPGLWDDNLGDGVLLLKQRISSLVRFGKYERWAHDTIRRPLESWHACRKLLAVIAASRWVTFSDIPAPVEDCLTLAVLLDRWERAVVPVPDDIRGMMHGAISVEWRKPAGGIVLMLGTCHAYGKLPAGVGSSKEKEE